MDPTVAVDAGSVEFGGLVATMAELAGVVVAAALPALCRVRATKATITPITPATLPMAVHTSVCRE